MLSVTLTNPLLKEAQEIEIDPGDFGFASVEGKIVTNHDVHAHNTFKEKENVKVTAFSDFSAENGKIKVKLPPCSVAALSVK